MDETHRLILQNQYLMTWAITIIAAEGFGSMVALAFCFYFARGTRESVRQVGESVERVAELVERQGYYLFTKLGPADTK